MTLPSIDEVHTPHDHCLQDKVILVTGASQGIGRAMALAYAQAGADVIILGRQEEKLIELYDQIEATTNTRPTIIPYDLNLLTLQAAKEMAHMIAENYTTLDGILHNAGILGSKMSIAQYPEQDWQQTLQINLNSNFYLTQACLPLIESSSNGRVLFTSSSVGRQSRGYWGAYAVSKFAIEGLMQTLAAEVGNTTSVRVHAINPGATRTHMRATAFPGENPAHLPDPQMHTPLYLFLMSSHSQQYNGLSIDAKHYLRSDSKRTSD